MRALPLRPRAAALAVAVAVVAAGCTAGAADERVESAAAASAATIASTTTTTAAPPTTAPPATAPVPPPGLQRGSTGEQVRQLEQRLADLHYDAGKVDGVFDAATGHAVMAFQKVHGLERTSRATDDVLAALASAGNPAPLLGDGGPNRVEVDLKRQVLFLYRDGGLLRILSISTGNNKRYCVGGSCAVAVTPGGSFKVGRKIRGLRVSRLGKLYNPLYFNGGIAIHGAPSVPGYPASHGCVRIPMHSSLWFFETVTSGTPVYVVGGKRAPVPFGEQAPEDASPPPPAPAPTTTTAPPPPSPTSTAPPVTSTTTSTTTPTTTTTTTTSPPPTLP